MADKVSQLQNLWKEFRVIDLSPTLEKGIPRWPTHPHLVIDQTVTHEKDGYYCQTLNLAEHTGAHVDAPAHVHAELMEKTIEKYAPDILIGKAVVYDISRFELRPGDQVEADIFIKVEENIKEEAKDGDIVLINFGWMKKYWRTDNKGYWYATNSPGLAESAVKLFYERGVKAIGSDTIACDQAVINGVSKPAAGHSIYWLPNDILIMEELNNLDLLPPICFFIAIPLKTKNGSGSPIRPIALVEK